jgi:double-strand break repair protein MRE11
MSRRRNVRRSQKRTIDAVDSDDERNNFDALMVDSKLIKNAAKSKNKKSSSSSSSSSSPTFSGLAPAQPKEYFVMPPREERTDPDQLRILISTDNHLGYAESDPVRRDDSFVAFEEVLEQGIKKHADLVLLGGDLFHENKPSRDTIYRSISTLRKYCLGDSEVTFELRSNQEENFRGEPEFRHANFEDPNYNVGLPVFCIHGNHDDPTREGGTKSLSANDILAAANMVNYFGTSERLEAISMRPVIFQKGTTNVALYGLGAMRDERLNRMFNQGKVKFHKPEPYDSEGDSIEYFNIFVLHQNREKGRGPKNCVSLLFL